MKETIEQAVNECVAQMLKAAGVAANVPGAQITVPKDKAHGDFATNIAMLVCKVCGKKPVDVAAALCASLCERLAGVATAEVAGPGFINFRLTSDSSAAVVRQLLRAGDDIGFAPAGKGRRVNVEYVSANPTGPLTVGHGRNAAVGDVIANLHAAAGYDVTREYYFNDAGNQMNVLARSVRTRYRQLHGSAEELEENGYQGDYIVEIARAVQLDHGDRLMEDDDLAVFRRYAVEATFAMIKNTLHRMNVVHDVYYNEHTLYTDGKIQRTLELIASKGLSYEKDGAVWFRAGQFGAEKDRVLVKSSGEPTYRLPDIAYHMTKYERHFDRMIDVFGADHLAQYPDVLACLKALGYDTSRIVVLIHQFVTVVRNGEVVKMSTRRANYITLDDLMDDVGVDATRYFFVMRRLSSHFEFDLELAKKQSLDNPVFYVQYAHARISSIFRRAAEVMPRVNVAALDAYSADASLLREEEELDLVHHLARFAETVEQSAEACEPHRVTDYLEKLAELFHRYYNKHQVVVEDEALAKARLALALVTQRVVRNGLRILGVSAPETM